MRFFVHHHVDLEMMELKTSSGRYKSLEEMRSDAATVFHNVMICFDGMFRYLPHHIIILTLIYLYYSE